MKFLKSRKLVSRILSLLFFYQPCVAMDNDFVDPDNFLQDQALLLSAIPYLPNRLGQPGVETSEEFSRMHADLLRKLGTFLCPGKDLKTTYSNQLELILQGQGPISLGYLCNHNPQFKRYVQCELYKLLQYLHMHIHITNQLLSKRPTTRTEFTASYNDYVGNVSDIIRALIDRCYYIKSLNSLTEFEFSQTLDYPSNLSTPNKALIEYSIFKIGEHIANLFSLFCPLNYECACKFKQDQENPEKIHLQFKLYGVNVNRAQTQPQSPIRIK